jgi:hypothetical protein
MRVTPGLRMEGARQNHLKNISLEIPHDRLTVITGSRAPANRHWSSTSCLPRVTGGTWSRSAPTPTCSWSVSIDPTSTGSSALTLPPEYSADNGAVKRILSRAARSSRPQANRPVWSEYSAERHPVHVPG